MSEIEMNVEEIVRQADQLGASDVHLIKGLPPISGWWASWSPSGRAGP